VKAAVKRCTLIQRQEAPRAAISGEKGVLTRGKRNGAVRGVTGREATDKATLYRGNQK